MADAYTNSIIATTLEDRSDETHDQVFDTQVLTMMLRKKKRVRAFDGIDLRQRLQVSANDSVGWQNPKAAMEVREQDPLQEVVFPLAYLAGTVPIHGWEKARNSGAAAIRDLGMDLVENLKQTMADTLGEGMNSDGTTDWGLQGTGAIFSASNTYPTSSGPQASGIARTSYSWWQANMDTDSEAWSEAIWKTLFRAASNNNGQDSPDLIMASEDTYGWYEDMLIAIKQLRSDEEVAELGFPNLAYNGAMVCLDKGLTAGSSYMWNLRYTWLREAKENFGKFVTEICDKLPNYSAGTEVVKYGWTGQLTVTRPVRFSGCTSKTTPT